MSTVRNPKADEEAKPSSKLLERSNLKILFGGVNTNLRKIGCKSKSLPTVISITKPANICIKPWVLGDITKEEPKSPRSTPKIVYETNLLVKKNKIALF